MANSSFPILIVLTKLWWNALCFQPPLVFAGVFRLIVHKGIQITQALEQFASLFCYIPWQVMGCEVNLCRPCCRRLKSLRSDSTAGCCQVEGSLMRKIHDLQVSWVSECDLKFRSRYCSSKRGMFSCVMEATVEFQLPSYKPVKT